MAAFIAIQVVLVPILGLLWLGIRNERQKQKMLYRKAIEAASINTYRRRSYGRY